MELFKPKGMSAPLNPQSDNQQNGQIYNPPRYARFGGLDGAGKVGPKNKMMLSKPGDTKKVI